MSYDPLLLTTGDPLLLSGSDGDLLLSTSEEGGEETGAFRPAYGGIGIIRRPTALVYQFSTHPVGAAVVVAPVRLPTVVQAPLLYGPRVRAMSSSGSQAPGEIVIVEPPVFLPTTQVEGIVPPYVPIPTGRE